MGLGQSNESITFEAPSEKYTATLYYFAGRGRADQIRWMLAAADIDFTQKVVSKRDHFLTLANRQLPFGQLPLLQIDDMEIVQSQAAVRYLARKTNLQGKNNEEMLKCDMIAEAINDILPLLLQCPFRKYGDIPLQTITSKNNNQNSIILNTTEFDKHKALLIEKWSFLGDRFEAIIRSNLLLRKKNTTNSSRATATKKENIITINDDDENNIIYMVGKSLTYVDILMAHLITWIAEECGGEVMKAMPLLTSLQNKIISLPGIKKFIKSINYFPLGDQQYVHQVEQH